MTAGISLIVAAADNGVIGRNNDLIWHIPEDLKHFKTLTTGKPCLMGRKTFESIVARLGKPLPNRTSIVVSRSGFEYEGVKVCGDVPSAVAEARTLTAGEIMVIGGAQIYEQALPLTDRIYLTEVHQSPEGDAFFPKPGSEWTETAREDFGGYSFVTLER